MENFYSQCTDMVVELMISSSSRAQSSPDVISSMLVLDTKKLFCSIRRSNHIPAGNIEVFLLLLQLLPRKT